MPRFRTNSLLLWVGIVVGLFRVSADTNGWHRLRSPGFEAITDADPRMAVPRLQRLERLQALLARHPMASRNPRLPTRVLFLRGGEGFALLRPAATNGPARVDGLYAHTPYENQLAINLDEDDRLSGQITQHEMMHLVCRDEHRHWPMWLAEGVACCLETARPAPGKFETGVPPIGFLEILRNRMMFDWEALVSMDRRELYSLPSHSAEVVYPQSWILCHYLLFGLRPSEAAKLPRLLELVEQGTNSMTSFRLAFGWTPKDIDARVRNHAHRRHLPVAAIPEDPAPPAEVDVHEASAAEAEAWITLWQVAVGRTAEARDRARRLAPDPGYYPQLAAGFLAFEDGDRDFAARHFRAAAGARPTDPLSRAYLARSLIESEIELGRLPLEAGRAAEARSALQEAIRLNPMLQPAHATLGLVEHYGGGDPGRASTALEAAIRLDPRDFGSRLLAGVVYERLGRGDRARSELQAVLESSRRLELVREARERLERLNPPQSLDFQRPGSERPLR